MAAETAKPYTLNDEIGKSGVEQTYEAYLRGTPGIRRIEVDAEGDPVRVISERPPRPGDDLVLVDRRRRAGPGRAEGRSRAWPTPGPGPTATAAATTARPGSAVVLDPNNGQVLAMASYPSYDPNTFVDGIDQAEWAYLNDPANGTPLNNWAIQGQWAPGLDLQAVRRATPRSWRA